MMMADDGKKSLQKQQAEQFSQLLKDYGISGKVSNPTPEQQKKLDELFPD